MLQIIWERAALKDTYTISHVYLNGELTDGTIYNRYYFCDGLEDKDRGLTSDMSESEIVKIKVKNETAIPIGDYLVDLNTVSPKYSSSSFMQEYANGARVPRLLNVKGFDGILIHTGNSDTDSSGCLLVGLNTVVGQVTSSKDTFKKLYPILQKAKGDVVIKICYRG